MSKWTKEVEQIVKDFIGSDEATEVTLTQVADLAEKLDFSDRSVAAKLRNMGFSVEKVSHVRAKTFTEEQEAQLIEFVNANPATYTHAEIAAHLFGEAISARQVQGKLLSLDLLANVKAVEHVEAPKKFTDEEEAIFIKLANSGAFLEDISAALGKELNSIRGKALSLLRKEQISAIPTQRELKIADVSDPLSELTDIASMTVEQIALAVDKTERGIKTMLTKRGIKVADYDGAKKAAKNEAKKLAA